ncbi:phage tail assembly protein [Burkholderia multivorans]|uniref:phage tail assembly protein n=1 Tax=Burkholderia multivorans TaxID=87883 RepID=UPI000667643F|nr:phage tail assembly protein [Burkholderia multivorans]MCO1384476.1 phage tail assembly protein [Burkholderia multivorans]MCO1399886.1 phage tail assembly protein [Burkholderia multivorans]MDN7871265.1 phage tail assembly protein [Burkholderia multivorans]MDN7965473.1 phage tail assembly protein [Burkholderia multivorans]MDN7998046.1 phage tail assembly protein [Burkholderia multivorans]
MEDEKIIRLKKPITLKGDSVTYDTITLREPTVDELDRSARTEGSVYAANAALIAMVAGVPLPVVRQMTKTDYEEATAFLAGFTWQPPQSGETSGTDGLTSPGSGAGGLTTSAG